jgi:hypothetical protein
VNRMQVSLRGRVYPDPHRRSQAPIHGSTAILAGDATIGPGPGDPGRATSPGEPRQSRRAPPVHPPAPTDSLPARLYAHMSQRPGREHGAPSVPAPIGMSPRTRPRAARRPRDRRCVVGRRHRHVGEGITGDPRQQRQRRILVHAWRSAHAPAHAARARAVDNAMSGRARLARRDPDHAPPRRYRTSGRRRFTLQTRPA